APVLHELTLRLEQCKAELQLLLVQLDAHLKAKTATIEPPASDLATTSANNSDLYDPNDENDDDDLNDFVVNDVRKRKRKRKGRRRRNPFIDNEAGVDSGASADEEESEDDETPKRKRRRKTKANKPKKLGIN